MSSVEPAYTPVSPSASPRPGAPPLQPAPVVVTLGEAPRDLDLAEIWRRLRRGWYWVAGGLAVALILASLWLSNAIYSYSIVMLVSPAQAIGNDRALSGGLASLASAAGVSVEEGGAAPPFKLYVSGLTSREAADELAQDGQLMRALFWQEWDAKAGRWQAPSGTVTSIARFVKSLLGLPQYPYRQPDGARLQELIQEMLVIDQNPRNPVVAVTFPARDPAMGVRFLSSLNRAVDGLLRQRTLLRTNDYIRYLEENLRTATLAEQRVAIAQTLGGQERLRMAARSTRPFAAEILQAPAASVRPTSPKPSRVMLLAGLAGLALGAAVAILRRPRAVRI